MKATLIIIGGFLGAGKTSLLWEMAKELTDNGEVVGLITNDQASELVDTTFLEAGENIVKEVSGSCFCCNFSGFADAIMHIHEKNNGGIILAEPVGSCTDLSATIMQPLKDKYGTDIELKPLTVLADPFKLKEILDNTSSSPAYIIEKQFEEADIILINKIDLISSSELKGLINEAQARWPGKKVMSVSVKNGTGLSTWFDTVIDSKSAGEKIAEVDYDLYADGEAAFGWLNATFDIEGKGDFYFIAPRFIYSLAKRFEDIGATVGHVKFLLQDKDQSIIGNITGGSDTAAIRKIYKYNDERILTVNARVEMNPDNLRDLILDEVDKSFGDLGYTVAALNCLVPGRPDPTYRYDKVIKD